MLTSSKLIAGLIGILFLLGLAEGAWAQASERRVALVIGNSAYKSATPLPNTVTDADDVTAALRATGFEVIDGRNLDRRGMGEALGRFARLADGADAALFYYAGHGLQVHGENYLVSIDSDPQDEFAVPYETTRLADVMAALGHAKGVRILVLDACRNNPLVNRIARSSRGRDVGAMRGLARISQNQGMVVAYATQANEVADDGEGRNSPFSAAFVEQLKEPGLEIGQVFRRVAVSVNRRTRGKQTPELSLSLLGDFYFNRSETDVQAWVKIREGNDAMALRGFLRSFPNSYLVDAAKARIDVVERSSREEVLRRQLAGFEEERRKAAEATEAARQVEAARVARETAERNRLTVSQAEARRKIEEEAARQQAEQQLRQNAHLPQPEAEERKAAEAESARLKVEQDRVVSERLARLDEDNRRAMSALSARFRAEEDARKAAEQDRARLLAELDAERRKTADELQRVQREKGEASAREQAAPGGTAAPSLQVANLPGSGTPPLASPSDRAELTKLIAQELRRVGCYQGRPNGAWSSKAISGAAREFARLARVGVPDVPTSEFLKQLRVREARVCPLVCSPRQVERGGVCIAKTCSRGERLDADGDCIAPPAPRRALPPAERRVVQRASPAVRPAARPAAPTRSAPAAPRGGRCFGFSGQTFCE